MFKKLMAKFGVGAATVDLRLDHNAFRLGETMTGIIHITGGNVEQRIADLSVSLVMKAYIRGREAIRPVQTFPVLHHFTVQPSPYRQAIPFQFEVPAGLAVSTPSIQYLLQTKLDVELAKDPTDLDSIQILPPAHVEKVFQILEKHDFRHKPDSGKLTPYGQAFSFFPGTGNGTLRELEIVFFEAPEEVRLLAEFDFAVQGWMKREAEYKTEIVLPRKLFDEGAEEELEQHLMGKLQTYIDNPQSIPYVSMTPYQQQYTGHRGSGIGGMIGGMAAGMLGGLLIGELLHEAGEIGHDIAGDEGTNDHDGFDDAFGGGFDDFGDL